jgi:hypothetical protein
MTAERSDASTNVVQAQLPTQQNYFPSTPGDWVGVLGLIVSIVGLWLTFREARAARRASDAAKSAAELAREAADNALKNRDSLETASLLSELATRLRELRDLTQSDDWSLLPMRFDSAASLCARILAAENHLSDEEKSLIETTREGVRACQSDTNGIKEASKRAAQKRKHFADLLKLVDAIEAAHLKRLKNGL